MQRAEKTLKKAHLYELGLLPFSLAKARFLRQQLEKWL